MTSALFFFFFLTLYSKMMSTVCVSDNHSFHQQPIERIATPTDESRQKARPKTAYKSRPAPSIIKCLLSSTPLQPKSSFDTVLPSPMNLVRAKSAPPGKSTQKQDVKSRPVTANPVPPASSPKSLIKPTSLTAHRRYDPVYPTANRLLAKLWDDAARKRHLSKLASMKSAVDNDPPKVHAHLACQFKKMQLQEEHKQKIKRENQILGQRLARRLQDTEGFATLSPLFLATKARGQRQRIEERQRITQENLTLIQRLEDRKPYYETKVWAQERRQNLTYLTNISRFPEGYASLLDRECIPHPDYMHAKEGEHKKLKIRLNRSTKLQKEAREASRVKSAEHKKEDMSEIKVGTTRSVVLRVEYLQKKKLEAAKLELELNPKGYGNERGHGRNVASASARIESGKDPR